jgi:PleD family two-component response regulator
MPADLEPTTAKERVPLRILIVDDYEMPCEAVRGLLHRLGHSLDVVTERSVVGGAHPAESMPVSDCPG